MSSKPKMQKTFQVSNKNPIFYITVISVYILRYHFVPLLTTMTTSVL